MGLLDDIGKVARGGMRIANTARVFAKHGIGFMLSGQGGDDGGLGGSRAAEALRKSFEELGATYIKLGQLIASAPGLFPREYVEEMQKCLDSVAPLPFTEIQKVVREEFNGKEKEIFAHIDPVPIASASIAQVHGATLTTGEDVVIKVQRPGIHSKLDADLNLLYLSALLFERITPGGARASLTGIVKDFHATIMEEVDFIKEAKNIEEFDDFLQVINQHEVIVPRVFHRHTTKRVLTMERLYGVAFTDLEAIGKLVKNPEETLVIALNTWFQSLLICGFFHADVHAGNLMVLNDGRVAFIDFGIVGRMDRKIWDALIDLMEGLSSENYKLIATALVNMNATHENVNIDQFTSQLEAVFEEFNKVGNNFEVDGMLDETKINELLMNLVQVAEQNGLKVPREFALLFKQMLYFDRYIRILAPDLDIMDGDQVQMRQLKA